MIIHKVVLLLLLIIRVPFFYLNSALSHSQVFFHWASLEIQFEGKEKSILQVMNIKEYAEVQISIDRQINYMLHYGGTCMCMEACMSLLVSGNWLSR